MGFKEITETFYERDFVFEKTNWEKVKTDLETENDNRIQIEEISNEAMIDEVKTLKFTDFVNKNDNGK